MRNADTELLFRQDSNFLYVCGVEEHSCEFMFEVGTDESTLVIPDIDDKFPVWHGQPKSKEEWMEQYKVSRVVYHNEIADLLNKMKAENRITRFFILPDPNHDGCPTKEWATTEENSKILKDALFKARAVKTPKEIEIMRQTCKLSGLAHEHLMRNCKIGLKESHLESLFLHYTSWRGARQQAYVPIVGTGTNGAILHYNKNNATINDGDLIVVDAGCEHQGYASDITRTFPGNGKFSEQQKIVYTIVLNAQKKLIESIAPGVVYSDLYKKAQNELLGGLIQAGFIINCDVATAISKQLLLIFMPHGLGHLLGLDVHDVSIYPQTPLIPGMIVTIEPGIYFNKFLINRSINDPNVNTFLNIPKLLECNNFGGIRIEDDVLVTETGFECLTSYAPKEIHHIEAIMSGTT
eukprot:TRINITY_DN11482_c0_g1_i1.p1 TRINITY_DN11482_c0_g1~~TRINITY_DN11482_c0_g1_i1.p1  ORF type:complete len:416 (-),score=78.42 TRINITY_DN11482_c0_g1_i1:116-1339(-)